MHLTDMDELGQKVRNSYSKKYLQESISSYRAGAYRSSVIATWIAVCVDIIEKIRELSQSGDGAAKKIEDRLNSIQANDFISMLKFEKEILNFACDELQFISVIEKSHLERLRDDRNVCAHPTFSIDGSQFVPSPELARAYIVQAASYLLMNIPVKGKVVVERLFSLVTEESFPSDDEKAFEVLSSDAYFGKVKESSVRNFTIVLLKRLFLDKSVISLDLMKRLSASLGAIERLYPAIYRDVFDPKFDQMLAEADEIILKRVFPFLSLRNDSWSKIGRAVLIRLEGSISTMVADEIIKYLIVSLSSTNQHINLMLQERLKNLTSSDVKKILESSPSNILRKYAIREFVSSGSFNAAYKNGITQLIPHGQFFNDDDIAELFEGILSNQTWGINQILSAGGIDEVFSHLYLASKKNVVNHSTVWADFWEKIKDRCLCETLKSQLMQDGVIEAEVVEVQVAEEECPF